MVNEIVLVNKEYYLIKDKVFYDDIDMYLCENYKTKNISLITPKQITHIINKDDYFIRKFKVVPNDIKYFTNFISKYINNENIDMFTKIFVSEDLLNNIYIEYDINLLPVTNPNSPLDKNLQICELFEILKNKYKNN